MPAALWQAKLVDVRASAGRLTRPRVQRLERRILHRALQVMVRLAPFPCPIRRPISASTIFQKHVGAP